ncbi:MAG: hypothetical protein KatS3mg011_2173 [Acidimicrobiia bacterium]|nr:MAG: hypothetical protein KatS3mg011_2173 [Acidimicrobiia bacterium]
MRRMMLAAAVAVLMVVSVAPAALAGEVKGPTGPDGAQGGDTPIAGFSFGEGAASICSFSGLNDVIDETEPTRTQSYGTFMVLIKNTLGVSTQEAKAILGESPDQLCNPNRAPWGNPKKA